MSNISFFATITFFPKTKLNIPCICNHEACPSLGIPLFICSLWKSQNLPRLSSSSIYDNLDRGHSSYTDNGISGSFHGYLSRIYRKQVFRQDGNNRNIVVSGGWALHLDTFLGGIISTVMRHGSSWGCFLCIRERKLWIGVSAAGDTRPDGRF